MPEPTPESLTVPEDLTEVEADSLQALLDAVTAEIDALANRAESEPESVTAEDGERALVLAANQQAIKAEAQRRADEQAGHVQAVRDALAATATATEPAEDPPAEAPPTEDTPADPPAEPPAEAPPADAPVEAVAAASRPPLTVAAVPRRGTLNPAMSAAEIARNAPRPGAQSAPRSVVPAVMTAAADIPGLGGLQIEKLDDLVTAVATRAKGMGVSAGNGQPAPVATITRTYEHVLGEGSTLADIDAAFADIDRRTTRDAMESLVAAGGWCAPSEIDYSLYDLTGPATGVVDVPTVGIRRGGLRWPESLDLAQFFALSGAAASGTATNATMPWLWTEADDIEAATGETPVKSCLRPPCPDFLEERLWLLGVCVLAGNLTQDAYPEVIRHFLSLVNVAHARVMNRRHNALIDANSTVLAVTPTKGAASSAITHFLGALELIATHERLRIGMSENAVFQLDVPTWVRGLLRSDIAKRNAWDDLSVADAWFMRQLDARNIRASWVEDWQSNTGWDGGGNTMGAATTPVVWPATFYTRMYPAGHFFRGAGMTLNLGVVRDSVLNAQNDFTAAWSEEASLIGARGNRAYRINFADMWPNGVSGAQTAQTAASA